MRPAHTLKIVCQSQDVSGI